MEQGNDPGNPFGNKGDLQDIFEMLFSGQGPRSNEKPPVEGIPAILDHFEEHIQKAREEARKGELDAMLQQFEFLSGEIAEIGNGMDRDLTEFGRLPLAETVKEQFREYDQK